MKDLEFENEHGDTVSLLQNVGNKSVTLYVRSDTIKNDEGSGYLTIVIPDIRVLKERIELASKWASFDDMTVAEFMEVYKNCNHSLDETGGCLNCGMHP